jgi:hypothetical protein
VSVRRALAAPAGALIVAGCQTLPAPSPWSAIALDDARVQGRLGALRALAASRRSLRANARVSQTGSAGASLSRQLVLLERPSRLRVEVVGPLGQRALALACDGETLDLYRAETGRIESQPVDAALLWRVARLPLQPTDAVGVLLAAPSLPEAPPSAELAADGALRLSWPELRATLDAAGRLVEVHLLAGAVDSVVARYSDLRGDGASAFPWRTELEFPAQRAGAVVELREVELNPVLDPSWFRLGRDSVSWREPERP